MIYFTKNMRFYTMTDADHKYNNVRLLPKQPKGPLLNVPFIIVFLITLCFCIYFIPQYFFSDQLYMESLELFSFIPVLFKADPLAFCHTIFSYSLMHGSFQHVAINMAWLLVFGSPLVRHLGSLRFLVFWMLMAAISVLIYFVFHQESMVPLVGASGAISGMMGAIVRYSFSPRHFDENMQNGRFFGPLLSVKQALSSKIVIIYISIWLIVDFIIGVSSFLFEGDSIAIAWEAHISGFVSGFLFVGFFDILRAK